ncbi:hypothetical protein KR018_002707, partial [Drosophila ironensis]
EPRTEIETTNYGPVSMAVNDLAQIAVNVSDESTGRLQAKMFRTLQDIRANIEVLTSSSLAELSDVIFETNQLLGSNPDCNPAWNLDELNENVTSQLTVCTEGLSSLLFNFSQNGQQAMARVQGFVQQIADLPAKCQGMGFSQLNPLATASSNVCFINGMAEVNVGMAQAMHNASLLLVQTHQATEEQVSLAQGCSGAVVQQVGNYLRQELDQCQQY